MFPVSSKPVADGPGFRLNASRLGLICAVVITSCLACACGENEESRPPPPSPPSSGTFDVEVNPDGVQGPVVTVTHTADPQRVLWETVPAGGFAAAAIAQETITEERGSFKIEDTIRISCDRQTVEDVIGAGDTVTLSGRLEGEGCDVGYTMHFEPVSENQLAFDLSLSDPSGEYNRVWLHYASSADERFYGFGEQFTYLNLKGRSFPVLCQEQGIGRGLEPLSLILDIVSPGSAGSWYTTYAAVPQYITNLRRSLFLENTEISVFNLEAADQVEIKLFGPHMHGRILYGDTPLDLIREYTDYAGRMPPLPDWINDGAVAGLQGGTEEVYAKLDELEAYDTPLAAFWLQDWVGQRKTFFGSQLWWNWVLDPQQYPGWDEMVRTLADKGIRVMIYINPYLANVADKTPPPARNLFDEAVENGYLVKNRQGQTYLISNTSFQAGIVDFTNPAARSWYKDVIVTEMLGIGASGWMADYGEGLPVDAVLYSGEDAAAYHNRYPEAWSGLNKEVLEEQDLLGEDVYFCRSGFTRSPGLNVLFWLGDQLVTFDGMDGMKSAIKGMLSGGFSGFSLNHSDIGGFTTISILGYRRTKELLMRWMEMAAFTAVYRFHEGNQPEENAQFYTDDETMAHFAKFAKVYRALAFYRRQLMQAAADSGIPLVRHPLLQFPDDPNVYDLEYQWMLGSEFMVAPVVEKGAVTVPVYLPAGTWVHVWTGQVYDSASEGKRFEAVPAPLGEPAVFFRQGSEAGNRFLENLKAEGVL